SSPAGPGPRAGRAPARAGEDWVAGCEGSWRAEVREPRPNLLGFRPETRGDLTKRSNPGAVRTPLSPRRGLRPLRAPRSAGRLARAPAPGSSRSARTSRPRVATGWETATRARCPCRAHAAP